MLLFHRHGSEKDIGSFHMQCHMTDGRQETQDMATTRKHIPSLYVPTPFWSRFNRLLW